MSAASSLLEQVDAAAFEHALIAGIQPYETPRVVGSDG